MSLDNPNGTIPVSGHNYTLTNLAHSNVLRNMGNMGSDEGPFIADWNPVLMWNQSNPQDADQLWKFLTYPSSNGETVFTLQVMSIIQGNSSAVIDGRGGYLRVDPTTNKLVQAGQPQAWKLIEVSPPAYKMMPFEDLFSGNGTLVVTDTSPTNHTEDPVEIQASLQNDTFEASQCWTFN